MKKYDLRERTYGFAVAMVRFLSNLSYAQVAYPLFNQLTRSATSIGANVEEADSSPTRKDFKHKLVISKKEAAETVYWLKLIVDADLLKTEGNIQKAKELLLEAEQLVKILGSIISKMSENDKLGMPSNE
jgi:four helix bundle protein